MPIRNPTEVEREGLSRLREAQIKASYRRSLPALAVWTAIGLVLAAAALGLYAVLN